MSPDSFAATPRAFAYVAGFFVPATKVEVTRSAFGDADVISVTTYAAGTPQDWGRITQKYMPTTFKVLLGMPDAATPFSASSMMTVIEGAVDEIIATNDTDEIEIRGRGVLSALIDKRTSTRASMNVSASAVIRQLIQEAGLVPQVADTPVRVGALLNKDYVGMNRNLRLLDFINGLAFGLGWKLRTNGNTVIVGPPPDQTQTYTMKRTWGTPSGGEKLRVTHSALHAHNVHVKVVSYIQSHKSIITSTNKQSPLAQALGLPPPATSSKGGSSGTGRQAGSTASDAENPNTQEYIYIVHGKSQAECDEIANQIATQIARKEFKMELMFTPTPDELQKMLNAGTEMLINLDGCPMPSNNGLYYPETITWRWDSKSEGLTVTINATNHYLPAPTGGLPNATL